MDKKNNQSEGMPDLFNVSPIVQKRIDFNALRKGDDSPLHDRCFVILGRFAYDRSDIKQALLAMGGEEKNQVSKNSHFVLLGTGAPEDQVESLKKLRKNGFKPRIITDDDELDELLYKGGEKFRVSKEIKKVLDFTWQHYTEQALELPGMQNPLARKELYFGTGLSGKADYFYQMCGNLGAFGNWSLNPSVQILVLSDATLAQLKEGQKDETIRAIEAYYNSTSAIMLEYRFISESAILDYCRRRVNEYNDEVMERLLEAYCQKN